MTANTIAQKFSREFRLIPESDYRDGFLDDNIFAGFVQRCYYKAVEINFPYGENSLDPTTEFVFGDGSSLTVSNPGQEFYRAFIS